MASVEADTMGFQVAVVVLSVRWLRYSLLLILAIVGLGWGVSVALEPTPAGPPVAPLPEQHTEAVVQVYGADVWGFRGNFAIHTWLAVKAEGARTYTSYQVIGWRRETSKVSITTGMPDRPWFRSPPILLHEVKGPRAQALIEPIQQAVASYPWAETYTMWPGPNSNSFIAWIALEVPELGLNLPTKAIGQGWMQDNHIAAEPL